MKIACVGAATAEKVRAFGIVPDLVPSAPEQESSSEGLLAIFPPHDDVLDPVDRVLLPRADIATETLAAGLRDRGWEIDDVTAYRTVRAAPPPAPIREAIKTGGFDAVCFTSSSTVRNLVGIAGKPHARTIVACIGPQTAETAREFGLRVDVQPEEARVPALVDALAAHAARLRAEGALPPPAEGEDPPPLTVEPSATRASCDRRPPALARRRTTCATNCGGARSPAGSPTTAHAACRTAGTRWPSRPTGPAGCAPRRRCGGSSPRPPCARASSCCRCS